MQTTTVILTYGAIILAVEVIRLGTYPIGSQKVINRSSEIRALVELGIAQVNGHCLVRHDGSERILGETLRAQLEQRALANSESARKAD